MLPGQTDIFRDDPRRMVRAYREAAETALVDPHYTLAERQKNHDYYAAEADKLERELPQAKDASRA